MELKGTSQRGAGDRDVSAGPPRAASASRRSTAMTLIASLVLLLGCGSDGGAAFAAEDATECRELGGGLVSRR
jgi:hypothetical protein